MGGAPELEVAKGLIASARQRLDANQLDAAMRLAERARDLYFGADDVQGACTGARLAAVARSRRGDLGGARELYEWIADEAGHTDLQGWVATARTELGNLAELTGDLLIARREHLAAEVAAGASGRDDLIAMTRGNLGRVRQRLGELELALADFDAALARFQAAGSAMGAINARICIGDVCRQLGRIDEASAAFDQAWSEARAVGHERLEALAALNVGHAARDLGRRDQAARAFARTLELGEATGDEHLLGGGRLGLGLLLAETGPAEEALAQFEAAEQAFLAAGQLSNVVACAVNAAAITCRLGALADGRGRMERALSVLENVADARGAAEVRLALAEVALAMSEASSAESFIADANADEHGPRVQRRAGMLGLRLALRSMEIETALALRATVTGLGEDLSVSERFALDLIEVEIDLLTGTRGVLDRAVGVADGLDARTTPREAAAAAATVGAVALWLGAFDLAAEKLAHAARSWDQLREPLGQAAALDALTRLALLTGAAVDVPALAERAARLDDLGALDAAQSLRVLTAIAQVRDQRLASPEDDGTEAVDAALLARVRSGHRLGLWSDLWLAATVLRDADFAMEAESMQRELEIWAPAWAASSRDLEPQG